MTLTHPHFRADRLPARSDSRLRLRLKPEARRIREEPSNGSTPIRPLASSLLMATSKRRSPATPNYEAPRASPATGVTRPIVERRHRG
jgi:hypothetical protein